MTVLAELLAQRKDLVTKIGKAHDAIVEAVVYEDTGKGTPLGDAEAEYKALDAELDEDLHALSALENQIRAANSRAKVQFDDEMLTISEAIVLRDRLKTEFSVRDQVAKAVEGLSGRRSRYGGFEFDRRSKDEIPLRTAKSAGELRDAASVVAHRLRLLDIAIQKENWTIEV